MADPFSIPFDLAQGTCAGKDYILRSSQRDTDNVWRINLQPLDDTLRRSYGETWKITTGVVMRFWKLLHVTDDGKECGEGEEETSHWNRWI